jgi:hypothetical protein
MDAKASLLTPNTNSSPGFGNKKNSSSHCSECGLPGHTARSHKKKMVEMLSFGENGIRKYCSSMIFPSIDQPQIRSNSTYFFFSAPVAHENWLYERNYAQRLNVCPGVNFIRLIATHHAYILANHLGGDVVFAWARGLSTGVYLSIFFFLSN